jgi:hypothetical protein
MLAPAVISSSEFIIMSFLSGQALLHDDAEVAEKLVHIANIGNDV